MSERFYIDLFVGSHSLLLVLSYEQTHLYLTFFDQCNMISFPDFAKPRFATFVKYGKTELVPPTPGEIPQAIAQATRLVQSGITFRWTKLSVRVRDSA